MEKKECILEGLFWGSGTNVVDWENLIGKILEAMFYY